MTLPSLSNYGVLLDLKFILPATARTGLTPSRREDWFLTPYYDPGALIVDGPTTKDSGVPNVQLHVADANNQVPCDCRTSMGYC